MTENEISLLSDFIDNPRERFSCDGCNDYELPDTEDNRTLVLAGLRANEPDYPHELSISKGKIHCMNSTVLHELQRRLTR